MLGKAFLFTFLVVFAARRAIGAEPVGLWPLNGHYGASDVTGNGNDGVPTGTQLAPGPYGNADGAFLFAGTGNSYIDIPNNGKLDVRYSITILAHIFPTGDSGPIFNYVEPNNLWAFHLWQSSTPTTLFMRTVPRYGDWETSKGVRGNVLQLNDWNYVGGRYDPATGYQAVFHDGNLVGQKYIGTYEIATQYPVRVGVRPTDPRRFAGRIACIQLYDYAMTQEEIAAARDRCKPCFVDLVFVVDLSSSIRRSRFDLAKQYIKNFTKCFTDQQQIGVGIVTYDCVPKTSIALWTYMLTDAGFVNAIDELSFTGGFSRTAAAIRHMTLTSDFRQGDGIHRVAIVITDGNDESDVEGQTVDDSAAEADAARDAGITLYSVANGIPGLANNNALEAIGPNPASIDSPCEVANRIIGDLCGQN